MKRMFRHRIYVILFFYLFSAFVTASHIHQDMSVAHDDCKVCVVSKNFNGGDAPQALSLPVADLPRVAVEHTPVLAYHTCVQKGFDAHAPPA